ncbi:hypothetical protein BDA96_08G006900 [Sorghum bicolor]|uniref:DUF7597 domain-containing protein n=2 Tax=Sorghum bicolor TaxID=4558 RepID=A0A921U673_SORBI|nr:hypothetical protein BDA96_08G006900 [Sorghum bicolor]KXG22779.2 hypothetical protein SORBI_3008G006500 [Sorghum bicolor]
MEHLDLNLRPGLGVQKVIKTKALFVSFAGFGRPFFLVASFGHCKFKLTTSSVGAILQATIGGCAADFGVLELSDRVFRFSVCLSSIGFHILNLRSFDCSAYKIFFHLWGNGGPNWIREWKSFCAEEEASWEKMKKPGARRRLGTSFADVVRSSVLSGANRVPLASRVDRQINPARKSVFDRIVFTNSASGDVSKGNNSIGRVHQVNCPSTGKGASKQPIWRSNDGSFTVPISGQGNPAQIEPNALGTEGVFGPQALSPEVFPSFSAWAKKQELSRKAAAAINLSTTQPPLFSAMTGGPVPLEPHSPETELRLGQGVISQANPSSSPDNHAVQVGGSNFSPATRKPLSTQLPSSSPPPVQVPRLDHINLPNFTVVSEMAYQRADPSPFKPRGTQILNIPNRPMMVRAVAPRRPRPRNEDLAIVTISPLPGNPLYFPAVEEVVREFFVHRRTQIKEVQPTHLGQAFVRFEREIDRDRFVLDSPHPYGDVHFSFVRHNQGRNWRRVEFNHQCWLMLMGLPEDYWEQEFLDTVLAPYARAVSWDSDPDNLARLIVRARTTDLESIPHFTVQIEILKHEHLGGGPPVEEQVPPQEDDQGPPLFDFFGLGQQLQPAVGQGIQEMQIGGQNGEPAADGDQDMPGINQNGQAQQDDPWMLWPEELPAIGQQAQGVNPQLNLNEGPVVMEQDLNEAPLPEDLQELIVHPAQEPDQEDLIEFVPQQVQPQIMEEVADNMEEIPMDDLMEDEELQAQANLDQQGAEFQDGEEDQDQELELINHQQEDQEDDAEIQMDNQGAQVIEQGHLPQDGVFFDHIQLGMVRTYFQPTPDLPWNLNAGGLSPKKEGPFQFGSKSLLEIPNAWVGFFQALLASPAQQAWAKKLLDSTLPDIIMNGKPGPIKDASPTTQACALLQNEHEDIDNLEDALPEEDLELTPPGKKRGRRNRSDTPLVDTMVRRSNRVRAGNNGFKASTCKVKNCLGCSSAPPILSASTLKKIGTSVCEIEPKKLEEMELMKRKKKVDPIGKKSKKNPDSKPDDSEDSSK